MRALDTAGSLGELAAQAGVTAKQLQIMTVAGATANVSQGTMINTLGRLNANIARTSETTSNLREQLKRYGVDLRSSTGGTVNTMEAFARIADAIQRTGSESDKARIAQLAFGRTGLQLLPLLAQGRRGIVQWADSLQKAGLILGDDMIAKADRASDAIRVLQIALSTGFQIGVIETFGDSVEATTENLIKAREAGRDFGVVAGVGMRVIAGLANMVAPLFEDLGREMDNFVRFKPKLDNFFSSLESNWANYANNIRSIVNDPSLSFADKLKEFAALNNAILKASGFDIKWNFDLAPARQALAEFAAYNDEVLKSSGFEIKWNFDLAPARRALTEFAAYNDELLKSGFDVKWNFDLAPAKAALTEFAAYNNEALRSAGFDIKWNFDLAPARQTISSFVDFAKTAWASLDLGLDWNFDLSPARQAISNFADFVKSVWSTLDLGLDWNFDLSPAIETIKNFGKTIGAILGDAWVGIVNTAKSIWDSLDLSLPSFDFDFSGALQSIDDFGVAVKASLSAVWAWAADAAKSVFTDLGWSLPSLDFGAAIKSLVDFGSAVKSLFGGVWDWVVKQFTSFTFSMPKLQIPSFEALNNLLGTIEKVKQGFADLTITLPEIPIPSLDGVFALLGQIKQSFAELDLRLPDITLPTAAGIKNVVAEISSLFANIDLHLPEIPLPSISGINDFVDRIRNLFVDIKFSLPEIGLPSFVGIQDFIGKIEQAFVDLDLRLPELSLPSITGIMGFVNQIKQLFSSFTLTLPELRVPSLDDLSGLLNLINSVKQAFSNVTLILPKIQLPSLSGMGDLFELIERVKQSFTGFELKLPEIELPSTEGVSRLVDWIEKQFADLSFELPALVMPTTVNITDLGRQIQEQFSDLVLQLPPIRLPVIDNILALINSIKSLFDKLDLQLPTIKLPTLAGMGALIDQIEQQVKDINLQLPDIKLPTIDFGSEVFDTLRAGVTAQLKKLYEEAKVWLDKLTDLFSLDEAVGRFLGSLQNMYDEAVGHSIIPELTVAIGEWMGRIPGLMINPVEEAVKGVNEAFADLDLESFDAFQSRLDALKDNAGAGAAASQGPNWLDRLKTSFTSLGRLGAPAPERAGPGGMMPAGGTGIFGGAGGGGFDIHSHDALIDKLKEENNTLQAAISLYGDYSKGLSEVEGQIAVLNTLREQGISLEEATATGLYKTLQANNELKQSLEGVAKVRRSLKGEADVLDAQIAARGKETEELRIQLRMLDLIAKSGKANAELARADVVALEQKRSKLAEINAVNDLDKQIAQQQLLLEFNGQETAEYLKRAQALNLELELNRQLTPEMQKQLDLLQQQREEIQQKQSMSNIDHQLAQQRLLLQYGGQQTAQYKAQLAILDKQYAEKRLLSEEEKRGITQVALNQDTIDKYYQQQQTLGDMTLESFKNALQGVQGLFADTFEKILNGGVTSFSDLASSVKQIFIRLAAEIAAMMIIRPVMGALTGPGMSAFFGGAGAAGTAGTAGQFGQLATVGGGGGVAAAINAFGGNLGFATPATAGGPSGGGWVSPSFAQGGPQGFLPPTPAATGFMGTNTTLTQSLGAGAIGVIGGTVVGSAVGGGGTGATVGGGIGGGVGAAAGMIGGPAGAIAGGMIGSVIGGFIGGMFDEKDKQKFRVKTVADMFSEGFGRLEMGGTNEIVSSFGKVLADFDKQIAALLDTHQKALASKAVQAMNTVSVKVKGFATEQEGFNLIRKRLEVILKAALPDIETARIFEGVQAGVQGNIEELVRRTKVAIGVIEEYNKLIGKGGQSEEVKAAGSALSNLQAHFAEVKAGAEALGLALGPLAAAHDKAVDALKADARRMVQDVLQYGGADTTPAVKEFRDQLAALTERFNIAIATAKSWNWAIDDLVKAQKAAITAFKLNVKIQIDDAIKGLNIGTESNALSEYHSQIQAINDEIARLAALAREVYTGPVAYKLEPKLAGLEESRKAALHKLWLDLRRGIDDVLSGVGIGDSDNTAVQQYRDSLDAINKQFSTLIAIAPEAFPVNFASKQEALRTAQATAQAKLRAEATGQIADLIAGAGVDTTGAAAQLREELEKVASSFADARAMAKELGMSTVTQTQLTDAEQKAKDAVIRTARAELDSLIANATAGGRYAQQLNDINQKFVNAISLARALGVSTEALAAAQAHQVQALKDEVQQRLDLLTADTTPAIAEFNDKLRELESQFAEVRSGAEALGLSVTGLTEAEQKAIEKIRASTTVGLEDQALGISRQFTAILDPLKQFQSELTYAIGGPIEQFQLAQTEFNRIAELAKQGDLTAIAALPQAGRLFLEQATAFGASPGRVSAEQQIQDVLANVIDATTKAQADATKGVQDEIRRASDREIDKLSEMVSNDKQIVSELVRLREAISASRRTA